MHRSNHSILVRRSRRESKNFPGSSAAHATSSRRFGARGALLLIAILAAWVIALVPPGVSNHTALASPPNAELTISGTVKSGARLLSGAAVTLYQAGTKTGDKAVSLGDATTDAQGRFAIEYTSPVEDAVLYLIAQAAPSADTSSPVKFAAVVGPAPTANLTVVVNELTTVSTAWAMAQFLQGDDIAGSSPGLPNAASMGANLADVRTGLVGEVLDTPPNGNADTSLGTFYSLANMLAVCAEGTLQDACAKLFALATPPGVLPPQDTLAAALNIAHAPGNNVPALFAYSQLGNDYIPTLDSAPDAWTLAVAFFASGTDGPGNIAFDSEGNLWVTNNYVQGTKSAEPGTIVLKFLPNGATAPGSPFSGGGILGGAWGIAINDEDSVWLGGFGVDPNATPPAVGNISLFSSDGTPQSPDTGFTEGETNRVQGMALDQEGNLWFANYGNDSLGMYPGGDPTKAKNFTGGGLDKPFGVAIDGEGNIWVTNSSGRSVSKFSPDGTPSTNSPLTGTGSQLVQPKGVAIDSQGNAWVADLLGSAVTVFQPDQTEAPESPFYASSIVGPWGIAVDGKDNIWVADFFGESVSVLCGATPANCPPGLKMGDPISPDTGYTSNGMQRPTSITIDPSGNVWVPNNWKHVPFPDNPGASGIVVFVGLASPVKTPLRGLPRVP